MSTKPLVLSANTIARLADDLGEAFAAQLRRVLRETERKLGPLLEQVTQGSRTAVVRASQTAKTRRELQAILRDAGYARMAETAYGARLDALDAEVMRGRRLAQASARLTASASQRLAALRQLGLRDLLHTADEVAYALWQATMRGVFASRSRADILADLAEILDDSEARIRTLYDTSVSIYGRQVEAIQAEQAAVEVPRFAYMGPVDEKTREFCLRHVGKVYTRDEIDRLDNGQLDNVFLTGGGYNCRHVWMEVSKVSELQDLGPRQRVPEVQDQLDALKEAA